MWVWSLGGDDPLEEGVATHSSILAWRIPWIEEPGGLQSITSQRIRHVWSNLACTDSALVVAQLLSCVWLSVTLWMVAHQAALSMGFSRQEYWKGLPCPPPGALPDPRIEPVSPESHILQADSLALSHQGTPNISFTSFYEHFYYYHI